MPKKIDAKVKERCVRQVLDHLSEYASLTAAAEAVARREGVGKESVRRWVIQAQIDGGQRQGRDERRAERDQGLEGEGAPARGGQRDPASGLDFLRGGTRPPQPLIVAFIDEMRAEGHAVESICRVLREQGCQVAARTYRQWTHAGQAVADRTISDAVVERRGPRAGLGRRRATVAGG